MYIMRRVHRKLDSIARNALHEAMSISPARRRIESHYDSLRERHKKTFGTFDVTERTIVSSLSAAGIYQTNLSDLSLPGTEAMLRAARGVRNDIEARLVRGPAETGDPYLIQASRHELLDRPEIYFYGLNEKILRIVEGYLGLPVAFNGFNFFYTLADGRERGARVWHLDGEDESIVKVAVYLNDVDMNGGPFEMIRNQVYKGECLYKRPAKHEKLERIVGKTISSDDVVTCTGRSGSVIFCDTARYYHRGRPATGSNRTAIFFNYYPRPPRRPYFCGRPVVAFEDFGMPDPPLSDYQMQSALWRENLPTVAKYVLPK